MENVDNQQVTGEQQAQLSEQQRVEQEALSAYKESQKTEAEKAEGVPEGYNEDGTPQEELIGGKFKSQDDLLKAYQELEKKQSQPQEEPPAEPAAVDPKAEPEATPPSFDEFNKEFVENGSLSDKSYDKLQEMGFSRQDVDRYIQGQRAYADSFTNDVYGTVGGQENYTEVVKWAADNIDKAVIEDYNNALANLDTVNAKRHLEYMQMKMNQNQPKETRRLEGDSPAVGLQPFTDKNEWQKAQTNRLYGKDAKYTNMVDQRYLASRKKGLI